MSVHKQTDICASARELDFLYEFSLKDKQNSSMCTADRPELYIPLYFLRKKVSLTEFQLENSMNWSLGFFISVSLAKTNLIFHRKWFKPNQTKLKLILSTGNSITFAKFLTFIYVRTAQWKLSGIFVSVTTR